MNLDNIHTPERLSGESQQEYRERQRMSRRLQQRTVLVHSIQSGPAATTKNRRLRRAANKQVGARQVKRLVRAYREAQALGLECGKEDK